MAGHRPAGAGRAGGDPRLWALINARTAPSRSPPSVDGGPPRRLSA
ncbi:hypothetical protein [Streptomyces demainii]|uniref:Uncharacterized protein n=1 Tax=Streptomyces demainii TaxID=588122 RepID=A0ABT9KK07_9ACTN|nr:hypothetical protein [Streptomyces demainii]MDP9608746.1 hypothetical protein [Streptomyces demainii]